MHLSLLSMKRLRAVGRWSVALTSVFALLTGAVLAQKAPPAPPEDRNVVSVLTNHNDNARTGANLRELRLNTANVNPNQFGKLFTRQVDAQVYAQPLYVPNLNIKGRIGRNVLYVATENNTIYAFDADDPAMSRPYWQVSFNNPAAGITAVPWWETGSADINDKVGITSTPVIDLPSNTMYVHSKTRWQDGQGNVTYHHHLHALNIITGQERNNSPVEITAIVPGIGDGTDGNGNVPFNSLRQHQRSGLLLLNGVIYMAFCSHGDNIPYHGWVIAYDAKTFQQIGVHNTTPNGKTDPSGYPLGAGGIWQSGQGLTADKDGNIYFMVGNGSFSAHPSLGNGIDYGDSFVKISSVPNANKMLPVLDFFAPANQGDLNVWDADLGSAGPMLIPGTNLLVGGGKDGRLFLLDTGSMGQYVPRVAGQNEDQQVVQWFWAYNGHLHGSPVFWEGPQGASVYLWSEQDVCKAFRLDRANRRLNTNPFAQSTMAVPGGMPGAFLSISANGNRTGTGILWALAPYDGNANGGTVGGILRAFDASNLKELWNSRMFSDRDNFGNYAKFNYVTIANGKVYVPTFSNQVAVYGLGNWAAVPVISPPGGEVRRPNTVTVSISCKTPGAVIRYTTDGSDPTKASTLYTGPFTVSSSSKVRARAFAAGYLDSGIAQAAYLIDNGPGNGDGLYGQYYGNIPDPANSDWPATPTATRIDPTVDFEWAGGEPIAGVGGNNWRGRWTGKVQARAAGVYTFYTISDDGIRLWVNDQLVIDNWTYHGPTENQGTITLTEGQMATVRLEFYQGGGYSSTHLSWSSDFLPKQVIPMSQLYSGKTAAPYARPRGGTFTTTQSVTLACLTTGADIRYTTNGTEPTANSTLYSGAINLTATTTLKAKAFKAGNTDSDTMTEVYTRNPNAARFRVNCGGAAAGTFTADNYFTGGNPATFTGTVDTSQVVNPAPQDVYLSERWGASSYTFSVSRGEINRNFTVRLHFAECWFGPGNPGGGGRGSRVCNVKINGNAALTNFDVFAEAGGSYIAIARDFTVRPTNTGQITIAFESVVDNPKISGIEIIPQ